MLIVDGRESNEKGAVCIYRERREGNWMSLHEFPGRGKEEKGSEGWG